MSNPSNAPDLDSFVSLRRDLHAYPELGFQEERTSELIASTLISWGIPVYRGLGKTGVVGILKKGTSPRTIGLRADMDALPITEQNSFNHASKSVGRMHACGHDGHMAMLLAAAWQLSTREQFDGTIYFVFQPAEEGGGGARSMVQQGLFERFPMEAIFGIHNWPGMGTGKFALRPGPVFASSNDFAMTIHGKGSHAAMPERSIDPIPAACQIVLALQSIVARNKRPVDAAVISTTMVHAGQATNVIPDSCEVRGTVRAFTPEVLDMIETRMRTVANATCQAYGAKCDFQFHRNYPPTVNSAPETEFARCVLNDLVGCENVLELEPTMAAEDFSFFLQEKPGCYFLIGNGEGAHRTPGHGEGPCVLHNASYDFNDELIPLGSSMWVRLAQRWLSRDV